MTVGRVFRRMGLPAWTFLGVGVSAIWFNYMGVIVERVIINLMQIDETSNRWLFLIPEAAILLIPCGIVLLAWLWQKKKYALSKLGFVSSDMRKPRGKKGLILLVSNPASAMFAINYHYRECETLESIWLIPSNDNEANKFGPNSQAKAAEIVDLIKNLEKKTGRSLRVEIYKDGVSPGDAQDTFDFVNRVFRRGGYEPNEIAADFTGGTKPMSVGMIMACLPMDRDLEYVSFNPISKQSSGPFLIDYQHSAFDLVG